MVSPSQELHHSAPLGADSARPPGGQAASAQDPSRWPWSARRTVIGAALWVVGVALLALLSVAAHGAGPFPGDVGLEKWVQQLHQPVLVRIVNFASDANWPTPAGAIAIAVIVALAIMRQVRAAIGAAISGFGADFVNVTLNGLVKRPRPYGDQIHAVAHLGLYSYPSGHVTHALAFYGFLLYLTPIFGRKWPKLKPLWLAMRVICLYFIIFVGPSRVLEGEHWPSDAVASYLLGALMLVVGIVVFHLLGMGWARFRERRQHHQSSVSGVAA